MNVYILDHWHNNGNAKTIGVFSNRENAELAIIVYLKKLGFQDYPDGFRVTEYEIDKSYWEDGFIISQ